MVLAVGGEKLPLEWHPPSRSRSFKSALSTSSILWDECSLGEHQSECFPLFQDGFNCLIREQAQYGRQGSSCGGFQTPLGWHATRDLAVNDLGAQDGTCRICTWAGRDPGEG